VQYHTQPANWREVQAGHLPSFTNTSALCSVDYQPASPENPEATKQMQLAFQLQKDGRIEEAIQHYHDALDADSNNPVVLNNLAWILASASKPELHNGNEAVRLATRAVELTDYRQPLYIGTLAAAYAEAGQFSKAVEAGNVARNLALLTGQQDVVEKNDELLTLYSSGKAVSATPVP
jgi:Tfp pilus assembly protein PilF